MNLTQHAATKEQIAQGVFDVPQEFKVSLESILTFKTCPTRLETYEKAFALFDFYCKVVQATTVDEKELAPAVMIGGAPFFMAPLDNVFADKKVIVKYAFSERVSQESLQDDGTVKKVNVFMHVGFV